MDVGVGKSSFALAIALRIAERGESAAFLSGEMEEERLWERALTIESRTKLDSIRRGTLSDETRAAVGAAAVRLRDRPLAYRPTAAATLEDVAERIRTCHAPFTAVDYLQLLPPAKAGLDHAEQGAAAVRILKETAIDAHTALLLIAQLPGHRADRPDPRPSLDDLGGRGAVKQHADVVLALYREEMYRPGQGMDGATELVVLKNRNGPTGFVDLFFHPRWLRFEDLLDRD